MGFEFLCGIARLFSSLFKELRFRIYDGPVFHRFLNHKYPYYSKLPRRLKLKFLRLVKDHYEYFDYIERDNLKLKRAMTASIASAASQLVLFLPNTSLTFFERIIVYPDFYNSKITHKVHKGEVNPGLRTIVFSWHGIADGLHRSDDGLNLLLHEFAHALWLEHKIMSHEYQVISPKWVAAFENYAIQEMPRLKNDSEHFFRRYAFENMDEFFAVAVENFFERSEKFKAHQPELYRILVQIFKQDPTQFYASQSKQKSLFR